MNLISWKYNTTTEYYLYNAHGDVVATTNTNGAVKRRYDYDAFGNEKGADTSSSGSSGESSEEGNVLGGGINPFRYCGEYWDKESGTYYLRARYYAPSIGRFTQQDTHWNTANMIYGDNPQKINEREDKLGLTAYTMVPQITAVMQAGNLYVYTGNNPLMYIDPTGEAWYHWVIGGVIVAAAAAAVVITAGGAVPAMCAVSAVASGTAATTTASTVAAGVFVGSSVSYGTTAFVAAMDSSSIREFNEQGNWGVVISTAAGSGIGGFYGYALDKSTFRQNISFDSRKLQHEYKHAPDYGITGNWNNSNKVAYEQAIRNEIYSVRNPIIGTYRGTTRVYHFFNRATGVNTMIDMQGNYVGGWKLSPEQIANLFRSGNVQ